MPETLRPEPQEKVAISPAAFLITTKAIGKVTDNMRFRVEGARETHGLDNYSVFVDVERTPCARSPATLSSPAALSDLRPAKMRLTAALALTALLCQATLQPALADNAMGYRLLTVADATQLPHNHGQLGIDVDSGGDIAQSGLTFEIMRVKSVHPGSPGQAAGLHTGDEIIAVDGRVFPGIAAFAGYIGSLPPGTAASFDTIPAGGTPAQAQRLKVRIGPNATHMSTGEKLAIGAGAVALLGCYELGCFSRHKPANPPVTQPSTPPQPSNTVQTQIPRAPTPAVSATCKDGTSWTGAQRSGACSHQGGVKVFNTAASNAQVWVNSKSKVYHCSGEPEYGKTKVGAYMTEVAAKAAGNRPSGGKTCS